MDSPTEPFTCRRINPGERKMPEPITDPIKRKSKSRRRSVRMSVGICDNATPRDTSAARTSIIAARWSPSMGICRLPQRNRHKAEDHYQRRGKESNPRGASDGMKQDCERIRSRENSLHQQAERKRYAKHDVYRRRIESRHDSRMHNAVNQDRDR